MVTNTVGYMNDYEDALVHLPDMEIRNPWRGRRPWCGTIAELVDDYRDSYTDVMIDYAKAAGIYREDEVTGEDNIDEVLPMLLATNLDALRELTDDPNAEHVWDRPMYLSWEHLKRGSTLYLFALDGYEWVMIDSEFVPAGPRRSVVRAGRVAQMCSRHNLPSTIKVEDY